MQISCSPCGIVDFNRPGQSLKDIRQAGFDRQVLDFSMGAGAGTLETLGKHFYQSSKYTIAVDDPARLGERMQPYLDKSAAAGVSFSIAYAPYLKRDTKHTDLNEKIERLAFESIRICGKAGCRYLVVRPLFAIAEEEPAGTDALWEQNRRFYLSLVEEAKEQHVMILLENQCKDVNGHLVRGICADSEEAVRWVDELNRMAAARYGQRETEYFGFCMNVGTYNLCGQNMYEAATVLQGRVKAVILRDCDGHREASLLPFTAVDFHAPQTDWLNLIRGLRQISFDGSLILDFSDTAVTYSPVLKPQLLSLAKSVAEYFKWQIGMEGLLKKYSSRVLFGAGNMCRNYMKNYGEAYPPLFTCDNNRALWGQRFEGLEIKNPEELKKLPQDTAIFICNMYYSEIKEQLIEMGIQNPIEFFSDEYMPTFYSDRLDAVNRTIE